jgi:ribonuclease-3
MTRTDVDIPEGFEERLGHTFRDRSLLVRALTHTSWRNEEAICEEDNQRLEFLGDAVVELVVSERLFRRYPDLGEGDLTRHRANLVRADRLAALARGLSIGKALRLGRGERRSGGATKESILSDAYEAVVGAIYLDGGLEAARACVELHVELALEGEDDDVPPQDAKSRLQEEVQAQHRITPRYELVEEHGPDHDKTFVVAVSVPGVLAARGEGHSKKEAAQAAAAAAWEELCGRRVAAAELAGAASPLAAAVATVGDEAPAAASSAAPGDGDGRDEG